MVGVVAGQEDVGGGDASGDGAAAHPEMVWHRIRGKRAREEEWLHRESEKEGVGGLFQKSDHRTPDASIWIRRLPRACAL